MCAILSGTRYCSPTRGSSFVSMGGGFTSKSLLRSLRIGRWFVSGKEMKKLNLSGLRARMGAFLARKAAPAASFYCIAPRTTMNELTISHYSSRLSSHYQFTKPNDIRALNLMNAAAAHVVTSISDLVVAYGVSDEYSFVFHRSTDLFERRAAKLVSTVVSTFTAAYVLLWNRVFAQPVSAGDGGGADGPNGADGGPLLSMDMLPTFDGRAVCYPTWENLRDYLSWRQVDCKSPFPCPQIC